MITITSAPCRQRSSIWSLKNTSQGSERHGSNVSLQSHHGPIGTIPAAVGSTAGTWSLGRDSSVGMLCTNTRPLLTKNQTKMCITWLWHPDCPECRRDLAALVFQQHTCCSAGSCPCSCAAPLGAEGPQGRACSISKRFSQGSFTEAVQRLLSWSWHS